MVLEWRGSPEDRLGREEINTRRRSGSFEDLAPDYIEQARIALTGNGAAAILARGEIAKSNISPQWPTKGALVALTKRLDRLKPSVLDSIPKEDENERLALTLALVSTHSKSLH